MIPFYKMRRALTFLDARRFSFLIRGRFKSANRGHFTAAEGLQLAFCDWMSHVESLKDGSVQDRVLDYCGTEFWEEFAQQLQKPRSEWPSVTVCFAGDQQYALLELRQKWYDIYQGQLLDELPKRPVTLLICDLTALWADMVDRMGGGTHDPGQESEAGERAGGDPQGVGRPG